MMKNRIPRSAIRISRAHSKRPALSRILSFELCTFRSFTQGFTFEQNHTLINITDVRLLSSAGCGERRDACVLAGFLKEGEAVPLQPRRRLATDS